MKSSPGALTPPTPSRKGIASSSSRCASDKPSRGLLLPLQGPNGTTPVAPHCAPAMCTPVDVDEHHTPPLELRRESLNVPPSGCMMRLAQGSGVSVYRMDRSPRDGKPRSPWVLKKANVSPILVRSTRWLKAHNIWYEHTFSLIHPHRIAICPQGARTPSCGAYPRARVLYAGGDEPPEYRRLSCSAAAFRRPPLPRAGTLRAFTVSTHTGASQTPRRLREPHARGAGR